MLDYINAVYGVHPWGDAMSLPIVFAGWVICGAHYFPDRVAPWLWLIAWNVYAWVTSMAVAVLAIHRGDVDVVCYHTLWVLLTMLAQVFLWRRLMTVVATRREEARVQRQFGHLARSFYEPPATLDHEGHDVIPGESWTSDDEHP